MVLKAEEVFVTSGKKKGQCSKGDQCSFRETDTESPYHPLSHKIQHEVEVSREKETPEAEASMINSIDRRVNTS